MELFDLPLSALDAATHEAVFGELPSALAADLHTPEVGDLVLQLLDKGWRTGQVAARVGALPAERDPVAAVTALLHALLEQVPPDARWRAERAEREAARSAARFEQPASEESRQRWISQIRAELGGPRREPRQPVTRSKPPCAVCGAESSYFVTREVRLCAPCVAVLGSGGARLSEAG